MDDVQAFVVKPQVNPEPYAEMLDPTARLLILSQALESTLNHDYSRCPKSLA